MADLIDFAFNDLLCRIDEFAVTVPRTPYGLSQSYEELEKILRDYRELVRFIEYALSLNED